MWVLSVHSQMFLFHLLFLLRKPKDRITHIMVQADTSHQHIPSTEFGDAQVDYCAKRESLAVLYQTGRFGELRTISGRARANFIRWGFKDVNEEKGRVE